jgi:RNA polymerase sigma factor (sigma-70 family)
MEGLIIDASSFEAAFIENFAVVHRFLARRVGTGLADELAAEAFAVAYRRRVSFDPSRGGVRPWLFGIAIMLLRAHWREEQRWLALEARVASERANSVTTTEDTVLAAELAPRLGDALAGLSGEQRDVLLLYAWGELSCEEIATALGQPAATVRSRLSRARGHLRGALGDLDPSPRLDANGSQPSSEGMRHERA